MWMLTFHVVLGYQSLPFWDFLWFFFFLVSFFSIQPTNPISGNASSAKWEKKGDGLTQKKISIGCISSSLDCFSITKKFRESFPARQTLHDNFLINEIGNLQFYRKLKYTCMQIWSNKINILILALSWSLCLYFFKSCFLLDAVSEKYSYISLATLL